MFKPELKNTGWEEVKDTIFEITGENYMESNFDMIVYDYELPDGKIIRLEEPNPKYTISEKKLATIINSSLMDIIWEATTISELEKHFVEAISNSEFNIVEFRLELDEDYVFGWVHYKHENRINTFRFKIDMKGEFKSC